VIFDFVVSWLDIDLIYINHAKSKADIHIALQYSCPCLLQPPPKDWIQPASRKVRGLFFRLAARHSAAIGLAWQ